MNRTMNGKRMSLKQVRVREALIKQNIRDNFSISDEEWNKINSEKISNRNNYVMAGTGSKKITAAKVVLHKKGRATVEIK